MGSLEPVITFPATTRDMILIMGLTKAGKSYFINKATGAEQGDDDLQAEGMNLKSCTKDCKVVESAIGNTSFAMMDCPGFDDTYLSDATILDKISYALAAARLVGMRLRGILYLHRITDIGMQGTNVKNLELVMKMVGRECLSNLVFITTMWDRVPSNERYKAQERDSELQRDFWMNYLSEGASTNRFLGTTSSAHGILSELLGRPDCVLRIQRELLDQDQRLVDTDAGRSLRPSILAREELYERRILDLNERFRYEEDDSKLLTYKQQKRQAIRKIDECVQDKKTLEKQTGVQLRDRLRQLKSVGFDKVKSGLQALAALTAIVFGITNEVLKYN